MSSSAALTLDRFRARWQRVERKELTRNRESDRVEREQTLGAHLQSDHRRGAATSNDALIGRRAIGSDQSRRSAEGHPRQPARDTRPARATARGGRSASARDSRGSGNSAASASTIVFRVRPIAAARLRGLPYLGDRRLDRAICACFEPRARQHYLEAAARVARPRCRRRRHPGSRVRRRPESTVADAGRSGSTSGTGHSSGPHSTDAGRTNGAPVTSRQRVRMSFE